MSTMPKSDARQPEGITEDYMREVLLPASGLFGYKGGLTSDIRPVEAGFQHDSRLYKLSMTGPEGEPIRTFVIKDYVPQEDALSVFKKEPPPPQVPYQREKQVLLTVGSPRLIAFDDHRHRLVLEAWDASFREFLDACYENYKNILDIKERQGFREHMSQYLRKALVTITRTSALLTANRHLFEETDYPPPRMDADHRAERLKTCLQAMVECRYSDPAKRQNAVEALKGKGKLDAELRKLASYLADGEEIIHYDARPDNLLVRPFDSPHLPGAFPDPGDIEITLSDYSDTRLGPISYDIVTLLHDTHVTQFGFSLEEDTALFEEGITRFYKETGRKLRKIGGAPNPGHIPQ